MAEALVSLGHVHRLSGEMPSAQALLVEGVRLAWDHGPRWLVAAGLEELAALAVADGRPTPAARFLHAAGALWEDMGRPCGPPTGPHWRASLQRHALLRATGGRRPTA